MRRTRIKICGITNLTDALAAVEVGADALGFVFYPPSSRFIEPKQAADIIYELPPFVVTTGLFVDAAVEDIERAIELVKLDLLQFHGNESPEFCNAFSRPYIKAIHVTENINLKAKAKQYSNARALLLDTSVSGMSGGTGQTFDWSIIPQFHPAKLILAGGLNPINIGQAVKKVKPYAVDISSGVEQSKGIKDKALMRELIQEVYSADKR